MLDERNSVPIVAGMKQIPADLKALLSPDEFRVALRLLKNPAASLDALHALRKMEQEAETRRLVK